MRRPRRGLPEPPPAAGHILLGVRHYGQFTHMAKRLFQHGGAGILSDRRQRLHAGFHFFVSLLRSVDLCAVNLLGVVETKSLMGCGERAEGNVLPMGGAQAPCAEDPRIESRRQSHGPGVAPCTAIRAVPAPRCGCLAAARTGRPAVHGSCPIDTTQLPLDLEHR